VSAIVQPTIDALVSDASQQGEVGFSVSKSD